MGKRLLCIWLVGIFFGLVSIGAESKVVVVEKGDTLYSIGREFNVSVQALIQANGIVNPRALKAGTRITVPNTYIVQKGDTLYGIARRNKISVEELREINDIETDAIIKVGQAIELPESAVSVAADEQESDSQADQSGDDRDPSDADTEGTHSAGTEEQPEEASQSYNEVVEGKDVLWPHTGNRSSLNGKLRGTQIAGSRGDEVVSVSSGKVVWVAPYRGYGNLVMVEASNGMIYAYGGNEATYVEVGEQVEAGTVLGRLGINPIEKTAKVFFFVYKNGKPVDPATAPRG
ncbi:MAG: LysM peptidoglycan-binding domain-containing protein [Spirochaetota bacterium]